MILKGLSYIHSKGYVHCDLKPENILVFPSDHRNITGYQLKIADFGVARKPGEKFPKDCKVEYIGTLPYMSPESVAYGEIEMELDIWSLGCIVAEMFTGKVVWQMGIDYDKVEDLVNLLAFSEKTPKIPQLMSEDGKDFLEKCFAREPWDRWTAEMLLDHPYIREVDSQFESDDSVVEPPRILIQEFPWWRPRNVVAYIFLTLIFFFSILFLVFF